MRVRAQDVGAPPVDAQMIDIGDQPPVYVGLLRCADRGNIGSVLPIEQHIGEPRVRQELLHRQVRGNDGAEVLPNIEVMLAIERRIEHQLAAQHEIVPAELAEFYAVQDESRQC